MEAGAGNEEAWIMRGQRAGSSGFCSCIEEIDGQQAAFIKYRVIGTGKKTLAHPRSVTHAIMLKNGRIYYVHLMVLFPGHLEEVRSDQITLVKAIIKH